MIDDTHDVYSINGISNKIKVNNHNECYSLTSISEIECIEIPINFKDDDLAASKCEQDTLFEVSNSDDSTTCCKYSLKTLLIAHLMMRTQKMTLILSKK